MARDECRTTTHTALAQHGCIQPTNKPAPDLEDTDGHLFVEEDQEGESDVEMMSVAQMRALSKAFARQDDAVREAKGEYLTVVATLTRQFEDSCEVSPRYGVKGPPHRL